MPAAFTFKTLRDYATSYRLDADCPLCRHHAQLNPFRVSRVVGWDAPLGRIRAALRCTMCGARGAEIRLSHDAGRPRRPTSPG
jgi:ribosomal protein S14